MAIPADRLTQPASRRLRSAQAVLFTAAFALAITAVALDAHQRFVLEAMAPLGPRLLAAAAMAVTGVAAVTAVMDRRRRGTIRRSGPWLLVAIGLGLIFLGQAIGYLMTVGYAGPVDARSESIPLLLGAPAAAVGLIALSWPPRMGVADRWAVTIDTALAALALLPVWLVFVVPGVEWADSPAENTFLRIDQWTHFGALVAVVAVASSSRRSGALPMRQIILLQAGTVAYLVSDILGDSLSQADRASAISWSIVGYVLAAGLLVSAALRPALEVDPPGSIRLREVWSSLVPLLPLVLLAFVIVTFRPWRGAMPGPAGPAAALAIFALITANVAARIGLSWQLRHAQQSAVAARLAEGVNEDWFAALVGDSNDVVTVVDPKGRILYQTPSVTAAFGHPADTFVGLSLADFATPADGHDLGHLLARAAIDESGRGPHDLTVRDQLGTPHATETTISPLRVLGADGFVLTTRDVTDRTLLRAQLSASESRDALTGLNNRDGFLARIGQLADVDGSRAAVGLIDLHGFRNINESIGHEAGDEVLRAVATCLARLPASVVAVARLGGDEFAICVQAPSPEAELGKVRRTLQAELAAVTLPSGHELEVEFASGYAVGAAGVVIDPASLLEEAGLALVAARTSGPGGMAKFDPTMRQALLERLRVERELRYALANDGILVFYQPIVSMADGRILGVEALVRMVTREGTLVSPMVFIPLAESIGLIHDLGRRVLQIALCDVQALSAATDKQLTVAVNVSALQLDPQLFATVIDARDACQVDAGLITLELTETVLAENQQAASEYLASLRGVGCRVALDDFGTGFSSLSYLASLPIDIIKIDRSFVIGLGRQESAMVLVRAVIQLARSLGLTTVAEGVETPEQADILRSLGADRAQGYLYSKPLSRSELETLLRSTGGWLAPPEPSAPSNALS